VVTVEDVAIASSEDHSTVSVPLDLTILNRGTRTLGYLGVCGLAAINPEASDAFSISRPCVLVVEPVEIEPGQEVSVSLLAIGSLEEWGDFEAGEYTLDLGLFVESISRAQLVRSTPFRIEVVPEEGE